MYNKLLLQININDSNLYEWQGGEGGGSGVDKNVAWTGESFCQSETEHISTWEGPHKEIAPISRKTCSLSALFTAAKVKIHTHNNSSYI